MLCPSLSFVALSTLLVGVRGQYGINQGASPLPISYGNNGSVGPDGPWWTIVQAVSYPDQFMTLLPSLSNNSLLIDSTACLSQSAICPNPQPDQFFTWTDSEIENNKTPSPELLPDGWDEWYAPLLNMSGTGQFFSERMNLHPEGDTSVVNEMDYLVMGISNSYTARFAGGAEYTMDTGFFSLYAEHDIFSWPDLISGYVWYNNRTLNDAYKLGYIPSVSYGLHVGSVVANVTPSLILGGYDSSRILTPPLVSDSRSFSLTGISLNVTEGDDAYISEQSLPLTGLLQANGSSVDSVDIYPDPGLPYMYLPRETCDAIAEHLPVEYNSDFNLYFWNTEDENYHKILTSPHVLAFSFSAGDSETTINIPLALMNLTLDYPLVSESTPYFPCSPWTPNSAPYHLGRSFLQGAFLGQNWNSSKLFLAQAPGPGAMARSLKMIAYTDEDIESATNAPSWDSTWSGTLTALQTEESQTPVVDTEDPDDGLSGGAIAGIVVGVVAGVAIIAGALFWVLRKRRQSARAHLGGQEEVRPYYATDSRSPSDGPTYYQDSPDLGFLDKGPTRRETQIGEQMPLAEISAKPDPVEMPTPQPQELVGSEPEEKYK
ncbi:hypothetical protein KC340_g11228 [Hortaea werneckii]|nr:hypothetical protein KC342_g13316 [Hortaea werneckii]KAI7083650.1 hypothetical protein KC339_g13069 [Hortaea werneckii]KAI7224825.1 hypothetical protein KC365_g10394 [Hortaea werneckii]KAI7307824.1 hypothetical protein KC340_g11228 [Hortaea werneckii]KAI7389777.1 hypothetical protein KC328_g8278 [Hortaea werneckii]